MKNKLFLGLLFTLFITCTSFLFAAKTIKHDLGTAKIKNTPQRVVVFDYGLLDIANEMGINVVGVVKGNLPAALSKYEDEKYANIGSLFEPNYETIIKLKPDLILIGGRQAPVYNQLKKIAPTLYFPANGYSYFKDLKNRVETLGDVFEKEKIVKEKLAQVENKQNMLKAKSSGKTALFLLINGTSLSVYGEGSRFDYLYSEFGFEPADKNIPVSKHGNKITFEYLLDKNPDYIFVLDRSHIAKSNTNAKETLNNNIVKNTDAYKNNSIIYVNFDNWYLIGGGVNSISEIMDEIKNFM